MAALAKESLRSLLIILTVAAAGAITGAAYAATVSVNCAKAQTIGAALAANSPANGGLTLLVSGTCTEDVVINRFSGVTIQGNPAATLQPVHATDSVVTANTRLILNSVAIAGGATGIAVGPHAYVTIEKSEITGTGTGVNAWDNSSLDLTDSTIATTGSYGIISGLGSTVAIRADNGDVTEITGAQTGVFCSSGKLNLTTAGSGSILIEKNKRLGLQPWDCGVQTYNPSGTIIITGNGTAGSYGAGIEQRGGFAILNSVQILNSAGFAAINASLNAGVQLNNVTITGNVAGISTNQAAIVQFVSYNGVSTVKNNGSAVFSCYQGGQIFVDKLANITPAPTAAQLGCLHVGGP
jgi:hypothetical protein